MVCPKSVIRAIGFILFYDVIKPLPSALEATLIYYQIRRYKVERKAVGIDIRE
jgi:hypothetical protein